MADSKRCQLPDRLTTSRLILDRVQPSDLADLARYCANAQSMAKVGVVQTTPQVAAWIEEQVAHWEQHGFGRWVLRDRATGEFLGRGGLRRNVIEGRDDVGVGYGLLPQFWGRGFATEMTREAIRLAFDLLGCDSVVAFTTCDNLPSQRVMQRCGMHYERDFLRENRPQVLYRTWRKPTSPSAGES
jgi:ribosomal-protein-alanine N-acetyltransferase